MTTKVKRTYESVRDELILAGLEEGKDFFPYSVLTDPKVLFTLEGASKLVNEIMMGKGAQ